MAGRLTQDIILTVNSPSSAKVRNSQDVTLVVAKPTTVQIRLSQDVTMVIVSSAARKISQPIMGVIT